MYVKTQIYSYRQNINQWYNTSSVVNDGFSRQLLNLLITGRYIILGEYHIRWTIGLMKLCMFINCVSIYVFSHNRCSIFILVYWNVMALELRNPDWHKPMWKSQEVHMEYLPYSAHKPFSKSSVCIPIDTIINIR